MDPEAPAVSVVMPVYGSPGSNTARYLPETLDSILAQTFADFELLILDDGSTDPQIPAILQRYADRDARVTVTTRENRGIITSRNELLAMARGRYMAANDADDLSTPDRLATQVAYLDAHPDVALLGTRVVEMDPEGSPVFVTGQPLEHDDIEKQLLDNLGGWAVVQSSMMCRTDAARKVGGYDVSLGPPGKPCFSEDHDFFVRMAEVGRVANLARPLAWYRRHYTSTTRTYYLEKVKEHAAAKERVLRTAHERRGKPFPAGWKFAPIEAPPKDEQARRWGWAALKHGNVAAARTHARAALAENKWSWPLWKLWLTAMRKPTSTKGDRFPEWSPVGT